MRVNIITNLTQGCGLWHDYTLLRSVLESTGCTVNGIDFQTPRPVPADLNIFLEVVVPSLYRCAPVQWLVPNPEWWPDVDLTCFSRVLCKTWSMYRIAEPLLGDRVRYTGFVSRNLYDPTVPRKKEFLHVAGKSEMKNTEAVLAAWRALPYPLAVVTHWPAIAHKVHTSGLKNVALAYQATEPELKKLFNTYRFHVCPSKTEGWGHYIHEALGVGACVISTDGPPMNEFEGLGFLVHAREAGQYRKATLYDVNVDGLRAAVGLCAALPDIELDYIAERARAAWGREWQGFRKRLTDVFAEGVW